MKNKVILNLLPILILVILFCFSLYEFYVAKVARDTESLFNSSSYCGESSTHNCKLNEDVVLVNKYIIQTTGRYSSTRWYMVIKDVNDNYYTSRIVYSAGDLYDISNINSHLKATLYNGKVMILYDNLDQNMLDTYDNPSLEEQNAILLAIILAASSVGIFVITIIKTIFRTRSIR